MLDAILFIIFGTGCVTWLVILILGIMSLVEILDKGSKK